MGDVESREAHCICLLGCFNLGILSMFTPIRRSQWGERVVAEIRKGRDN